MRFSMLVRSTAPAATRHLSPAFRCQFFTESFPRWSIQLKYESPCWCLLVSLAVSSSTDYPLADPSLLLINGRSPCVQQHASTMYKQRTLGFVTSSFVATALSISASILFTPLLLNIYHHTHSTGTEEI